MPTGIRAPRLELHARAGRAVLVEVTDRGARELDPVRMELPDVLVRSLHEWAEVVDTLTPMNPESSGGDSGQVISRRARQLAVRLAVETGGEVAYLDPVTGRVSRVGRQRAARSTRDTGQYGAVPRHEEGPPTPWATGLTVAAIIAAIVVVALVVVTFGLAEVNVFLALGVNLAVAAGLAPSIWLGRRVLVWRWVALGTACGIVLAWIALLLSALG